MKKSIAAALAVSAGAMVGVAPAGAAHVHSKLTGNGSCVLLAQDGGEKNVQLPFATGAANRLHPLHVLVHLGEPGMGGHITIGVANTATDPCLGGTYVNAH